MGMKWIKKAQEKGAIVIHVDPRYTRTSAGADIYARIRAGSDIAFLNAMTNYILQHKLYDEEYVKLNTNALMRAKADFDFNDGIFSGFDGATHHYETASWNTNSTARRSPQKQRRSMIPSASLHPEEILQPLYFGTRFSDLGHPCRADQTDRRDHGQAQAGCIMYALGATQHTSGVQQIRCYGIIQLLLGNIGVPGGGVNALRGSRTCRAPATWRTQFLPSRYLNYPNADQPTLKEWTRATAPSVKSSSLTR